ncbi:MAG: dihydrofolate reductase [Clostridia bacterium]|jgi:dihydrofolate reductase
MISFIAAVAKNKVIGRDNGLPWHLPSDLRYFREITMTGSRTMIMGRKTFESLPKVLPGRKHVILTRNMNFRVDDENVEVIHSVDEILPYAEVQEEVFIIGGGQVFQILLPLAQRMYITEIYEEFDGDTYFPIYHPDEWMIVSKKEGITDERDPYKYSFLILERKTEKR